MNTEAILGAGGTGKSTLLRTRIEADPQYALLSATTGIAAINLGDGVTTVHSALGFYDQKSLVEAHKHGRIKSKAIDLAVRGKKNLVIDEISMFSADAVSLVHEGFQQAADLREDKGLPSCGLILSGDFCQLSPVPDDKISNQIKYAFESLYWPLYEANLTQLTKVYRQGNPALLASLQMARQGRGVDAAIGLKQCGVEFARTADDKFDGITLFPTNKEVGDFNERRLADLPGEIVTIPSKRWGKERGEWKNIPQCLQLKDGALVMVLVNQGGTFQYVNGDLATFRVIKHLSTDPLEREAEEIFGEAIPETYTVETKRGYKGPIPFTIRRNHSYAPTDSCEDAFNSSPSGKQLNTIEDNEGRSKKWIAVYLDYMAIQTMRGVPYYDPRERGTVIGEVEYMPLRLAYGSSYHKVQGLTLDKVQINISHFWAGQPGMLYVALTRARSVEGLKIVGDVALLAKRIRTDSRVKRWV